MKKILFLIFFVALFASPLLAFGDDPYDPGLEIEYPWLDEEAADETEQVGIYIAYLFKFGVTIVGLILFGALVYGGFVFMTSAGNPERRSEAKRKIIAAFLGTILLLGFYVLINEINPDLLQVSLEEPEEIKYPPIPAGPYICTFDFPGIDGILSNYESGDSEMRNNAIKDYYDTLRSKEEEDDDYYCTIINTPRNIQVQLAAGPATYFIVPDKDGNYNYGMIFFNTEDGLRKARADGKGFMCHVSIGKESIVGEVEDIGFFTKSVAPISLESEGTATIRLYEGYTFNSTGDSKNNEKTEGYALHEETFSVGPGLTENIIGETELSSFPSKETTVDLNSGIYYGIRSLKIEESPVISIFKREKEEYGEKYDYCSVIIEDRSDLTSIIQSSTIYFLRWNDVAVFNGLSTVLRFNEIHLIKGQLMDSER